MAPILGVRLFLGFLVFREKRPLFFNATDIFLFFLSPLLCFLFFQEKKLSPFPTPRNPRGREIFSRTDSTLKRHSPK